MPDDRRVIKLPRAERLRDSRQQTTSMSLPLVVHYRLDRLARLAEDVAATRAEIIAMLIAEARLDVDELEQRVLAYRKLTVGRVAPSEDGPQDAEIIAIPLAQQGRPRKRSRGG